MAGGMGGGWKKERAGAGGLGKKHRTELKAHSCGGVGTWN